MRLKEGPGVTGSYSGLWTRLLSRSCDNSYSLGAHILGVADLLMSLVDILGAGTRVNQAQTLTEA